MRLYFEYCVTTVTTHDHTLKNITGTGWYMNWHIIQLVTTILTNYIFWNYFWLFVGFCSDFVDFCFVFSGFSGDFWSFWFFKCLDCGCLWCLMWCVNWFWDTWEYICSMWEVALVTFEDVDCCVVSCVITNPHNTWHNTTIHIFKCHQCHFSHGANVLPSVSKPVNTSHQTPQTSTVQTFKKPKTPKISTKTTKNKTKINKITTKPHKKSKIVPKI